MSHTPHVPFSGRGQWVELANGAQRRRLACLANKAHPKEAKAALAAFVRYKQGLRNWEAWIKNPLGGSEPLPGTKRAPLLTASYLRSLHQDAIANAPGLFRRWLATVRAKKFERWFATLKGDCPLP